MTAKAKRYKVLRPIRSDKKKSYFDVGDTVTSKDFPQVIINGWLAIEPPVLEEVKGGSDSKRQG